MWLFILWLGKIHNCIFSPSSISAPQITGIHNYHKANPCKGTRDMNVKLIFTNQFISYILICQLNFYEYAASLNSSSAPVTLFKVSKSNI